MVPPKDDHADDRQGHRELRRVLFVDDEEDIRMIASMALADMGGLDVLACGSGDEAVARAPSFAPDLVVLDVMMPGLDGPATYDALIASGIDAVFVFLTARADETRLEERLGVEAVILKPFEPVVFADQLREIYSQAMSESFDRKTDPLSGSFSLDRLGRLEPADLRDGEFSEGGRVSLRLLAKAVQNMSLGVTITDRHGRIVYVNPADARQHGWEVKNLVGRPARIYAAPDDDAPLAEDPEPGTEPWSRERLNITRDGEVFPAQLVSDRLYDDQGEPIATVTICEDIRERIRQRDALAASEAKYRELLESAHDLIVSITADGRFQFVNRAWKDTLGYDDEEVSALRLWDVVRDEPGREDVLERLLTGAGDRVEAVFVAKNGREIEVEGTVHRRLQDGRPTAAQGIFRDITERKAVDRMKQEFLATISHELRTPLTSIIASLGLLGDQRLAGEDNAGKRQDLVEVAHRNSQRLLGLINDLLDLQKIQARKMSFRRDRLTVEPLLADAVAGIEALAGSFGVTLRLKTEDSQQARGDRERLLQVMTNLLSNAIKFSPRGSEVTVTARDNGNRVYIGVTDQGPGIPEELHDRLFDQFTQADSSSARAAGGSGLGLSIAKGMVEGMGGRIDFHTGPEGTTFVVELPAA